MLFVIFQMINGNTEYPCSKGTFASEGKTMIDVKSAMEDIDDLSQDFSFCKPYESPEHTKRLLQEFLGSHFQNIPCDTAVNLEHGSQYENASAFHIKTLQHHVST